MAQSQQQNPNTVGKHPSLNLQDFIIFWPIVIVGLAVDLWTKKAVFDWLANKYPPVHIVIKGFLRIVVQENTGAAFGIASGQRILLVTISMIAAIAVLGFFFLGKHTTTMTIALALFLAGILGNAYDRIFNDGVVRDFIDVHYKDLHWPAFNVADSMLCIAVAILIIGSYSKTLHKT